MGSVMVDKREVDPEVVWKGRPSIGVFIALYGVLALVTMGLIAAFGIWGSYNLPSIAPILRASLRVGPVSVPYAVEIGAAIIIFLLFLVKAIRLSIFKASHLYELRVDGLRLARGLVNLEDDYISAVAFSDARLIRTLEMRIVGRGLIIIEANDERRFEMRMIKDAAKVQSLIRRTLSHPTVKIDRESIGELRRANATPAEVSGPEPSR
jgi:hypothetical protein